MKRRLFSLLPALAAAALVGGVAYAATTDLESLRVGTAGSGGVTFFNGSVVNESGPVVVADDLRVDGRITRLDGEENKPVIVNDGLEVEGDTEVKGDLTVEGDLTVSDIVTNTTAVRSVGVPSFVPSSDEYEYARNQETIAHETGPLSGGKAVGRYYATLDLPQGSEITSLSTLLVDEFGQITVALYRTSSDDPFETLATVTGNDGSVEEQTRTDSSIKNATVDNDAYHYGIRVTFADGDGDDAVQSFRGAKVTYRAVSPF